MFLDHLSTLTVCLGWHLASVSFHAPQIVKWNRFAGLCLGTAKYEETQKDSTPQPLKKLGLRGTESACLGEEKKAAWSLADC